MVVTSACKHCVFFPYLNLQFSNIVSLDHLKLESVTPLKCIDSAIRLSSAATVKCMSL